jgi:hypothetical protein
MLFLIRIPKALALNTGTQAGYFKSYFFQEFLLTFRANVFTDFFFYLCHITARSWDISEDTGFFCDKAAVFGVVTKSKACTGPTTNYAMAYSGYKFESHVRAL